MLDAFKKGGRGALSATKGVRTWLIVLSFEMTVGKKNSRGKEIGRAQQSWNSSLHVEVKRPHGGTAP